MENEQPQQQQSQDMQPSIPPQMVPPSPPMLPATERDRTKEYLAVLIGVGIIFTLVIWYMAREQSFEQMPPSSPAVGRMPVEPDIAALQSQGNSDSVSAIESDLNATGLDDLDREMDTMRQEMGF